MYIRKYKSLRGPTYFKKYIFILSLTLQQMYIYIYIYIYVLAFFKNNLFCSYIRVIYVYASRLLLSSENIYGNSKYQ